MLEASSFREPRAKATDRPVDSMATAVETATATAMETETEAMPLRAAELASYERLFLAADAARAGRVEGGAAVAFFGRAGLPVPTLKQIWLRADARQQGFLSRQPFFVALRLVALAQQGQDVSTADALAVGLDVPLPLFQGERRCRGWWSLVGPLWS